ncbi:MAG TPA: hypothetical protein VGH11_01180, partial [Jatrophihabitans sp.]
MAGHDPLLPPLLCWLELPLDTDDPPDPEAALELALVGLELALAALELAPAEPALVEPEPLPAEVVPVVP